MYPQMKFFKTYFTKLSMIKKFLEYPKSLPSDLFLSFKLGQYRYSIGASVNSIDSVHSMFTSLDSSGSKRFHLSLHYFPSAFG